HLRVPAPDLMSKVNSRFQKFFHCNCSQNFISLVYVLNETANEPKRFADGFDRRSKASGGCERATANDPRTTILLSFRELESRTGAFLTVFLTFFLARVACDQPRFFQCRTQVRVEFHQCT